MAAILEVSDLDVRFDTPEGAVWAVNDMSFAVEQGECLGIVGESGSGKTQVFLALMGLLAKNGRATGSVRYRGREILHLPAKQLNAIRGVTMSMIFQDPMTSLNPYLRVSRQLSEVLIEHKGASEADARRRGIEMLERVGIPEAAKRFDMYPHELSGGMRQRAMIAIALLCEPDLLIADEPSTALDVTIQAQILDLIGSLRTDFNTAVVMITHDLGVIAGLCERVMVMYGGRAVETGPVRDLFYQARHPYTLGLLGSMPRLDEAGHRVLNAIPGQPPNLQALPPGCSFEPRCPYRAERCRRERPLLREVGAGRMSACHFDDLERRRGAA